MKRQLRRTVWNALAVWGAVSLVVVITVTVTVTYWFVTNQPRIDQAGTRDVRFVLNWPGLGEDRIESVLRSYESGVHFTGDHFTAYAIRVASLSESELTLERRWARGDQADALMREAINFVTEARHDAPWLPPADELLSDRYYVWRSRVEVGEGVSAAALIFARPSDRMIFYASLQV